MRLKYNILLLFFICIQALAQEVPHTVDEEGNYYYPPINESASEVQYEKAPTQIEPTEEQKQRGVKRITGDGEHIYGYEKSQTNRTMSIRFGSMDAPQVKNSSGLKFEDIYDDKFGFVQFDYEWKKNSKIGVFGIVLGSGIAMTTGSGRFAETNEEALEEYTFYTIPTHLSINYRFQYSETQKFVPFITGGVGYFGALEIRDDNKRNKIDSAAVAIAGGGIMISVSGLDSVDSAELDESYGVKDLWISLDYRRNVGLDNNLDYSGNVINLGIILDM